MELNAAQESNGISEKAVVPVVDDKKKSIQVSKKTKQKQPEIALVVTADQIKLAEEAADKFLKELDLEEESNKKKNNNNKGNNKKKK